MALCRALLSMRPNTCQLKKDLGILDPVLLNLTKSLHTAFPMLSFSVFFFKIKRTRFRVFEVNIILIRFPCYSLQVSARLSIIDNVERLSFKTTDHA